MATGKTLQALIWLVDPLERDVVQLVLQRLGFQTGAINDPVTFLEQAKTISPDVIILDMLLPGSNALDLIRTVKAFPGSQPSKSIVISSLAFPDVISHALEVGVDDFMVKPLDSLVFETKLRKLVNLALSAR